jgi:hypothetical protein
MGDVNDIRMSVEVMGATMAMAGEEEINDSNLGDKEESV